MMSLTLRLPTLLVETCRGHKSTGWREGLIHLLTQFEVVEIRFKTQTETRSSFGLTEAWKNHFPKCICVDPDPADSIAMQCWTMMQLVCGVGSAPWCAKKPLSAVV